MNLYGRTFRAGDVSLPLFNCCLLVKTTPPRIPKLAIAKISAIAPPRFRKGGRGERAFHNWAKKAGEMGETAW